MKYRPPIYCECGAVLYETPSGEDHVTVCCRSLHCPKHGVKRRVKLLDVNEVPMEDGDAPS